MRSDFGVELFDLGRLGLSTKNSNLPQLFEPVKSIIFPWLSVSNFLHPISSRLSLFKHMRSLFLFANFRKHQSYSVSVPCIIVLVDKIDGVAEVWTPATKTHLVEMIDAGGNEKSFPLTLYQFERRKPKPK